MKTKATTTKVNLTITHDRLAIVTTFPNGDQFKFSASRGGERISTAQNPSNPPITQPQMDALATLVKFQPTDTTNLERFERIKAVCAQAPDLIALANLAPAKKTKKTAPQIPAAPTTPTDVTGDDLSKRRSLIVHIGGKKQTVAASLKAASDQYRAYIDEDELRSSEAEGCRVVDVVHGTEWTVSYNGRVWTK